MLNGLSRRSQLSPTVDEQSRRFVCVELVRRKRSLNRSDGQGWHAPCELAGNSQWFSTRRQNAGLGTCAQDGVGELRAGHDQVFAVVQHHQLVARAQSGQKRCTNGLAC
jgi:hypothetical protein